MIQRSKQIGQRIISIDLARKLMIKEKGLTHHCPTIQELYVYGIGGSIHLGNAHVGVLCIDQPSHIASATTRTQLHESIVCRKRGGRIECLLWWCLRCQATAVRPLTASGFQHCLLQAHFRIYSKMVTPRIVPSVCILGSPIRNATVPSSDTVRNSDASHGNIETEMWSAFKSSRSTTSLSILSSTQLPKHHLNIKPEASDKTPVTDYWLGAIMARKLYRV